jgi:hypothetical protein
MSKGGWARIELGASKRHPKKLAACPIRIAAERYFAGLKGKVAGTVDSLFKLLFAEKE